MVSPASQELCTLAQNVVRLDDARPLLDGWAARGIRPVALKGLALLHTLYADDLFARPMSDLDFLVPPERIAEAEEVLLDLGYARVPQHQHTFQGGRGPTRIDLTDQVWYLEPDRLRGFIGRARPVDRDGIRLCIPALEDHLLHIAVHAVVMHGQLRPGWREDVRRLVAAGPDWQLLVARARDVRLTVPLFLALERLQEEGATVPTAVLETLRPRGGDRLVARLLTAILERPETHETGHLLQLLCRDGVGRKARAFARHLFPRSEFIARRYGTRSRSGVLVHRVWRPASTLGRTVRYAWRTLGTGRTRRGEVV